MQCIFRANKMADARITNVDTGDSTDVSCVYPHVGPSGIHIKLSLCLDLVSTCNFCLIH